MLQHASLAEQYFRDGCNCAQSVLCAFMDCTGWDYETSMKFGASFGGGFGRMREVCGAFSGICLIAGHLWGYTDTSDKSLKTAHYALVQDMAARFKAAHSTLLCRELLAGIESGSDFTPSDRTAEYYQKRPCPGIVASAAGVLDEIIRERGFTRVETYPLGFLKDYRYVAIFSRMDGKWLYTRAQNRDGWETAGGHIEPGETPLEAAKRELWAETGALEYEIHPMFDYSAHGPDGFACTQVFYADITALGPLPEDFEMAEVGLYDTYPDTLRLPEILPVLYRKMNKLLSEGERK